MRYLLDTNVCIAALQGTAPRVVARLELLPPEQVCLCSVVKAELLFGARKSARVERNLERFTRFFEPMESLPFDDRAAEYYGQLRAFLEGSGCPIGGNDLMIASVALAHDLVVVTANTDEFRRVPGLRVETW